MSFRDILLRIFFVSFFISSFNAHADTWLFDFGPALQITTPNYNNITNPGIQSYTGLLNADGQTTGVSLTITIPFNTSGTNSNGTTTPAIEIGFSANATRDSFFGNIVSFQGNVVPNSQIQLTGLDPAQLYDFTIFASRMGATDNRQTEYKISGTNSQTVYLDATENSSEVVTVTNVQPATNGTVLIDLAPGPDNTNANKFFYLGAMKVASHTSAPTICDANDSTPDNTLIKYPFVEGVSPYTMGHWLYRPAGYSYPPCKKYPLLIWLHGLGEVCKKPTAGMTPQQIADLASSSLDLLNKSGLNAPGYQIKQGTAYTNQRPFLDGIILEPQTCSSWNASNIDLMIEYVKTKLRVDEDRIYVTGLSLGGGGTWAYAAGKPTKVAAIVPVAGTNLSVGSINNASHVPTWAFHNYNDTNVGSGPGPETGLFRCLGFTHRFCTIEHIDRMIPFAEKRVMEDYSANHGATQAATDRTAAIGKILPTDLLPMQWNWANGRLPQNSSSKTIMTIFAAGGHGGWEAAYGMQEMWQWLYAQKREPAPTLKVNSPLIAPINAGVTSGATVVVSAKIALGGVPIGQVVADLKALGGSNVAPLSYETATKTYKLSYALPTSGLTPGDKGVAIIAVDTNGNRTVKYVTFTINP